jgi:hypothetical protein
LKNNFSLLSIKMNTLTTITQKEIENKIFTFRNIQVMIDRDLADMYQVEVKRLNEQIKRNKERFPESFRFQLSDNETFELVANCDRFKLLKHSSSNPYAFTEQGVAMLSAVLHSQIAIKVSIQIINAFVEMRKLISQNNGLLFRLDSIERKLFENDQKFEQVFKALERKDVIPSQGVFFEGQIYDAYELTSKIIRSAKNRIVLIDNYIDETSLTLLTKKAKDVNVLLLTKNISKQLNLDVQKVNQQYSHFELKLFTKSHDRFLIIDEEEVYHIGASLKDLGKKWFAFSKISKNSVRSILAEI